MTKDVWSWPAEPTTDAEFEAMMRSLDGHLARRGIPCMNRHMMAWLYVSKVAGVSPAMIPSFLRDASEPTPPLLAKANEWLTETYRNRPNPHFDSLCIALDLNGTVWKLDVPMGFGQQCLSFEPTWDPSTKAIGAHVSVLGHIRGFTPFAAARLTPEELTSIQQAVDVGFPAVMGLMQLDVTPLFSAARLDYTHSVDALASGIAWHKARWDTAQAAEKLMKGMLDAQNLPYTNRGAKGHHLKVIGDDFERGTGRRIPLELLEALDCEPFARYGQGDASREQAMAAHRALHRLLLFLTVTPSLSGEEV
jgi:hypothetical protein